ncbi:hypothetical protein BH10BAC4_BH10BAC4_11580 [soil metagenome]
MCVYSSLFYSLLAALFLSSIALAGLLLYFVSGKALNRLLPYLLSLAMGILLGNAFLHLIPDSIKIIGSTERACFWVLIGVIVFFSIEKIIHREKPSSTIMSTDQLLAMKPLGKMTLIANGLHNFTDGAMIAGSFSIDTQLGLLTVLTLAAHELPREISGTGVLVYSGYPLIKAIRLNFMTALSSLLGVIAVFSIGIFIKEFLPYCVPLAAGGFIYIATCNLAPELQKKFLFSEHVYHAMLVAVGPAWMFFH